MIHRWIKYNGKLEQYVTISKLKLLFILIQITLCKIKKKLGGYKVKSFYLLFASLGKNRRFYYWLKRDTRSTLHRRKHTT